MSTVAVPECVIRSVETACLSEAKCLETTWMKHASDLLHEEKLTNADAISWAAYHASRQQCAPQAPVVGSLLPLFYEKAATPAMVKPGMDIVRQASQYLNPGQIPITTFDQPLFARARFF